MWGSAVDDDTEDIKKDPRMTGRYKQRCVRVRRTDVFLHVSNATGTGCSENNEFFFIFNEKRFYVESPVCEREQRQLPSRSEPTRQEKNVRCVILASIVYITRRKLRAG